MKMNSLLSLMILISGSGLYGMELSQEQQLRYEEEIKNETDAKKVLDIMEQAPFHVQRQFRGFQGVIRFPEKPQELFDKLISLSLCKQKGLIDLFTTNEKTQTGIKKLSRLMKQLSKNKKFSAYKEITKQNAKEIAETAFDTAIYAAQVYEVINPNQDSTAEITKHAETLNDQMNNTDPEFMKITRKKDTIAKRLMHKTPPKSPARRKKAREKRKTLKQIANSPSQTKIKF